MRRAAAEPETRSPFNTRGAAILFGQSVRGAADLLGELRWVPVVAGGRHPAVSEPADGGRPDREAPGRLVVGPEPAPLEGEGGVVADRALHLEPGVGRQGRESADRAGSVVEKASANCAGSKRSPDPTSSQLASSVRNDATRAPSWALHALTRSWIHLTSATGTPLATTGLTLRRTARPVDHPF